MYIPRKDEQRGLIAIEDCVECEVRRLEVYVPGNEERLIHAARGDRVDGLEAASVLKEAKKEKRLQDWEEKTLYGQYLRQTKKVRTEQRGLGSKCRFKDGNKESDSCSTES